LAFDRAAAAGVEAVALRCRMSAEEIVVDRPIPIVG
jgi:DNA-binding sugar fermentation-stimulating protein